MTSEELKSTSEWMSKPLEERKKLVAEWSSPRRPTQFDASDGAPATTGSDSILSITDGAALSASSEIAIKRAIARRTLKAQVVGTDQEWRILSGDLTRYIGAGTPDIMPPAIAGQWFGSRVDALSAQKFSNALLAACEAQVPTGDALAAKLADAYRAAARAATNPRVSELGDPGTRTFQFALAVTPAVLKVLTSPPVLMDAIFATDDDGSDIARAGKVYRDWRDLYLSERLKVFGKRVIPAVLPAISQLYDSPAAYQTFTQAAGKRLLETQAVVFTRGTVVTDPVPRTGQVTLTGDFRLSNEAILPADGIAGAIARAF